MPTMLASDQIDRLLANAHPHPYEILGAHQSPTPEDPQQWTIRVMLPRATSVAVVLEGSGKEYPLDRIQGDLFATVISSPQSPRYQLKVDWDWGETELRQDAYAYHPEFVGDMDIHLFGEGNHHRIYDKLGSQLTQVNGVSGVHFALWAPNARSVSLLGDFTFWDGRYYPMERIEGGLWILFVPGLKVGTIYKYEVKNAAGHLYEKSDPYGFQQEMRPKTGSIVTDIDTYTWHDQNWLDQRALQDPIREPISVYEVHLGSWLHASSQEPPLDAEGKPQAFLAVDQKDQARYLTYRELADKLVPYVKKLGFTHIELLPVAEHPFDGSWGYQVIGHYAATSRYGSPQDLMYLIDQCHQDGIGVIMDWVPGHFPKDGHGLAFFDGTHLYEYEDPRRGEHKEWGTLVFNYGRHEVRNYLVANALFWLEKYHIDGIRVDAVASTLYLDYDREDWLPNQYGGREHIEAIDFFRQLNSLIFQYYPGTLSIAEESTSWPMVTWPAHLGGLGFNFKWNMGWMHDMLDYFHMDPWFRQFNHHLITFSLMYAFSENYMLAFSHDEVVHGKGPMLDKMPGDEWGKFASLRALYGYMFTHPGKKTMFMSMEFGQTTEWSVWTDLNWDLLKHEPHRKLQEYVGSLNQLFKSEPALYTQDHQPGGFNWIDCNDQSGVISFLRYSDQPGNYLVVVCNFAPVTREHYRIGVPDKAFYREVLNSDATEYWGTGIGNLGGKWSEDWAYHNLPYSLPLCIPPLSILVLKPQFEQQQLDAGSINGEAIIG
ncbi:MAG: 1,4-alpha-glucan branching protein GlgB [Cyanophyceae cyanobacterium]